MFASIRSASALLVLLVLACAAPRSSAPSSGAAATSGAQAANTEAPRPALVCRTERPTGSNIPRRVCYTQDELDEMSRAAQDAHRRATQSATQPRHD